MDGAGLGLGIVAAVMQTYKTVIATYDLYLGIVEFPLTYQELRMGLLIERYRLELWGNHVLSEHEQERVRPSQKDLGLWKLFEWIFLRIHEAFQEINRVMEGYGQHTAPPVRDGISGNVKISSK